MPHPKVHTQNQKILKTAAQKNRARRKKIAVKEQQSSQKTKALK